MCIRDRVSTQSTWGQILIIIIIKQYIYLSISFNLSLKCISDNTNFILMYQTDQIPVKSNLGNNSIESSNKKPQRPLQQLFKIKNAIQTESCNQVSATKSINTRRSQLQSASSMKHYTSASNLNSIQNQLSQQAIPKINLDKKKTSTADIVTGSRPITSAKSGEISNLSKRNSQFTTKLNNFFDTEQLQRLNSSKFPTAYKRNQPEPTFDQILSCEYDKDMFQYKHKNKRCIKQEGKEQIHKFIYDKKKQNALKYSAKSKINQTALPVPRGTISIMLNVDKKDFGFNLNNFKKKIPAKSKFKMKWKIIQWLINNKKDAIKQIFTNYNLMMKFAKGKKGGMNRQEFGELLSYVGLGADENFADKLFYIFDEDNSQSVDYKELIIGLETFKESSIDEKLKGNYKIQFKEYKIVSIQYLKICIIAEHYKQVNKINI
eukprot:TRINITY_DN7552_c0_g1_i1.p1 TRINITY_DN7552_c0_g1~~TRINITY_DN7552_c0_g1_i1.p1  ORF type:complete len:433 (-),score=83.37 TRINITY_DN7552_c0_g1_i1:31-1329(-)